MKLYNGECLEVMKTMPDNSIDIIFTDPPYALGSEIIIKENGKPDYYKAVDFMSKWDMPTGDFWEEWYCEAIRVLKQGGHCLMFGMDRQLLLFKYYAHLAGFTEKQSLYWFFISNFPKATDLSKMIDKNAGAEREVVGKKTGRCATPVANIKGGKYIGYEGNIDLSDITAPSTPLAKKYAGYKYSIAPLKQTNETIMVFQKPYITGSCLHDTLAMEAGDDSITAGCINIDGNRVGTETIINQGGNKTGSNVPTIRKDWKQTEHTGRYPSQCFCNSESAAALDRQSGVKSTKSGGCSKILHKCDFEKNEHDIYFYCPKVSKAERNAGLDGIQKKQYSHDGREKNIENPYQRNNSISENNHPTVKPIKLITNILKLFKTPNPQACLDPFMGSGSIGIVCRQIDIDFIGIEKDADYYTIAKNRIEHAQNNVQLLFKE